MCNFADSTIFDQLLRVDQCARAFMLQADLYNSIRTFGRGQALVRFRNRPRHRLFSIEIFTRSKRVDEMPGVDVQRAGYDDAVDVFHVEQAAVIIERLDVRNFALRLIAPTAVDVGHHYKVDVRNLRRSDPADHSRDRRRQSCRRGLDHSHQALSRKDTQVRAAPMAACFRKVRRVCSVIRSSKNQWSGNSNQVVGSQ